MTRLFAMRAAASEPGAKVRRRTSPLFASRQLTVPRAFPLSFRTSPPPTKAPMKK